MTTHAAVRKAVDALVADSAVVESVYQPIVDLVSGTCIGFEALARWPSIGPVDVDAVFVDARSRGLLSHVESACRTAALNGALDAHLATDLTLFVNFEPDLGVQEWLSRGDNEATTRRVASRLRMVVELTESALLADPSALMATVAWARASGFGVALDDVGANPQTLAMLPVVAPDVVKLDASLVRSAQSPTGSRVMAAINEYVRSSGAIMVAEGIETEDDRRRAVSLGATLGQGWFYGKPGSLPCRTAP
ncbi:EAL domain-containing protein [Rhodococcus sp. 06-156-3C]|uniref:EAL domain-containing protein n=1 Tax=Nocardiaceae TaxID=85025 RepID=UPI000689ACC4|nr:MULTISPECIES: EAL domain-containing protein [Rhodococcus]OZD13049.1 EAL domain-containing protein [Rhodococcus sp. 06-156-4a]OZD17918.1 EAL domain-containing protein [Rhodococcus sp. 06-156-3C]OZD20642.1 EAL domain-containing protein [Rhodococcus sp. 06-156-4C]OZD30640.1 EAL domain-containing protein [Rhodococcus sp. 06-156-3b]OZD32588.1 EAL domain-containing protein [Rhodococcus sp. 06-156-3]